MSRNSSPTSSVAVEVQTQRTGSGSRHRSHRAHPPWHLTDVLNTSTGQLIAKILEELGYRSMLMLPLVSRGETIGLMEIADVRDREWDEG